MTCIVGVAEKGHVYIGADSAGTGLEDLSSSIRRDSKVFQNGPYLMAYTGSFRVGQLLRYALEPPECPDRQDDVLGFMVTHFVDVVRRCLKDGGVAVEGKDRAEAVIGNFLVGFRGRLYPVYADYQVAYEHDLFEGVQAVALGCAYPLALGALYAMGPRGPAKKRILAALSAAEYYSAGVRRPFVLGHLRP